MVDEPKSERDIWLEAIVKLMELTRSGRLQWSAKVVSEDMNTEPGRRILGIYEARHEDHILRLTEVSLRAKPADVFQQIRENKTGGQWILHVELELVKQIGVAGWTFPSSAALWDLLNAAKYQSSGVQEFMKGLLGESNLPGKPGL